jgi:exonuclease VII large subunit
MAGDMTDAKKTDAAPATSVLPAPSAAQEGASPTSDELVAAFDQMTERARTTLVTFAKRQLASFGRLLDALEEAGTEEPRQRPPKD